MALKKEQDINYKALIITAGVTALTVAVVNNMFYKAKGLGLPAKLIANLPLERQAQFAELATIQNVRNPEFFKKYLSTVDIDSPDFYKNVNAKAVGNCAFLVLHTTDLELRNICLKILENYKIYA